MNNAILKYFAFLLVGGISGWIVGCSSDLEGVYEDFRAEAPPICKDYCEEKVGCEWNSSAIGEEEENGFSAAIRMCTAVCAAQSVEGAYVWHADPTGSYDRIYDDYLNGDLLFSGFSCLYQLGAYRCVTPVGTDISTHRLNPPVTSICSESSACLSEYELDYYLTWETESSGIGGSCTQRGADHIGAIFFE